MMMSTDIVGYWYRAPQEAIVLIHQAALEMFSLAGGNGTNFDSGMVLNYDLHESPTSQHWMSGTISARICVRWFTSHSFTNCFIFSPRHDLVRLIMGWWRDLACRAGDTSLSFEPVRFDLAKIVSFAESTKTLRGIHFIHTDVITTMTTYSVFRCKQIAPFLQLPRLLRNDEEICWCLVHVGARWDCTIRDRWFELDAGDLNAEHLLDETYVFACHLIELATRSNAIP